ncbi:MAG: [Fe-Fe] hydrogenase large subunit C-terminal domain-containing protein [Acidobacteriota bacterium]|nr:[Fe-Fe] hydrogenase large subunit C-terminal domain-containing protein [Acidobacteriota bacterium]
MNGETPHSLSVNDEKCLGCVYCLTACPTKAIRIKGGKARILDNLCIDCGECMRFCPRDAIESRTTSFSDLGAFKYKVAIPATVLYGQFDNSVQPGEILFALRRIGFDYVYEISTICELNNAAIEKYLNSHPEPRPLISSTCPVVVRLVQRRFPALCELIAPIEPPREIAAKILRANLPRVLKIPSSDIGILHITPCSAKMVSINRPATMEKSYLDGAISIRDIYKPILQAIRQNQEDTIMCHLFPEILLSGIGMGTALSGGETRGLKNHRTVAVSGVRDTIRVLNQVEIGLLKDVDLLECTVCPDGCVGGPLAVENRFLAKSRIQHLVDKLGDRTVVDGSDISLLYHRDFLSFHHPVQPMRPPALDSDPGQAIRKAKRRSRLVQKLPGKDCGACGAPDCRTLADDVVRGLAELTDCPFVKEEKK